MTNYVYVIRKINSSNLLKIKGLWLLEYLNIKWRENDISIIYQFGYNNNEQKKDY